MNKLMRAFSLILGISALCHSAASNADALRVEQSAANVSFDASAWQYFHGPALSDGTLVASATAGATIEIRFSGTSIAWIGYRCPCAAGLAQVYLDGTLYATVDSYAARPEPRSEIYRISGLPDGEHVLALRVTGARNPAGEAAYVAVDAFDVRTAAAVQTLQEIDGAVSYTGDWQRVPDSATSGGYAFASREAGASATVDFTGTGIAWIGYQCDCASGIAQLTLDGVPAGEVATYPGGARGGGIVQYSVANLPYGAHTLRLEVTGEGTTDRPWVVVDAFRILGGNRDERGDLADPTVIVTAPADGSRVSGIVRLEASAEDDTGIASLYFYAGGQEIGPLMSAPPYFAYWDTTTLPDGVYTVGAIAIDEAGKTALPPAEANTLVTVENVDDPPRVEMTAPASGTQVTGTVRIAAEATDDYGVVLVRFLAGNTVIGEDSTPPWEITRDTSNLPSGSSYLLHAVAIDTAGNVGGSSAIIVTVQHQP